MKRMRLFVVIPVLIILMAVILMACTDEINENAYDLNETGAENIPAETETQPATAAPVVSAAKIPQDADYTITYALVNTEGKYADLSIGPLIAAYNVLDYGADPTGVLDNTRIFQTLINRIGNLGGGTLYIPEGFYRINSTLTVMKGVTIRGDWVKPDKNLPDGIEGTVLLAYTGRDKTPTDSPFIETEVGAGVMDLTIFYPEQDPNNIVPYSPAIRLGVDDYFGNEYNNVKNVTLINAYIGVLFSRTNGGASPVVNGLYGSPLLTGVDIDNIADVGRIEWLNFSPDYWINCGLYEKLGMENPFESEISVQFVRDYIYNNGTGLIMRRNDWSYACYLTVDGYKNGYMGAYSNSSMEGTPNGHNYDFYFTNCQTGVYIEATNSVGILFNKVIIENCEYGIKIAPSTSGAAQFANCTIDASIYAIDIDSSSGTKLLLNESVITEGAANIKGGTLQATDVDFLSEVGGFNLNPHIYIGESGRANIVGCRFNGDPWIMNDSFFASNIDHTPTESKKAPKFPEMQQVVKTPAKFNLYVVPYHKVDAAIDSTKTDYSGIIQSMLDQVAADGGGYVYLPAGKYKLYNYIVIPSGVELVGSMANSSVPHGEGSILECYYGKDDKNALPLIQLKENAGLRGITIDYPLQVYEEPEKSSDYKPDFYPYAIQGQGNNIYIINVGVRATYAALDLFTYKCDNFYVDFLAGHMFNYGVRVGGNCENGILSNLMCNTIVYAAGQESKFGSFENSPPSYSSNGPLYEYGMMNLDFLILGDCKDITLYNCFNYGAYRGILLQNDGVGGPENGVSMGLGLDGDTYSFYIDEGVTTKNFDFINTQIVTLTNNYSPNDTSYIYSKGNNSFDISLFTSDYWGSPVYAVYLGESSGALNLETAHFNNTGQALLNPKGGSFSLENGSVDSINNIVEDSSKSFTFISIIASTIGESYGLLAVHSWENNISNSMEFSAGGIIADTAIDRSSWKASASDNTGVARRVYDGKISTRWDTGTQQVPGQWFELDLGGEYTFNYLILDVGSSTSDTPADWAVYVSPNGFTWGEPIASGKGGSGIIPFETQTARYIRIEQNGRKDGLYWSIHEIYVCNIPNK